MSKGEEAAHELEKRINTSNRMSGMKMFAYVDGSYAFFPGSLFGRGYVLSQKQAKDVLDHADKKEMNYVTLILLAGGIGGATSFIDSTALFISIAAVVLVAACFWDYVWKVKRFKKLVPGTEKTTHRFPFQAYWQRLMARGLYSLPACFFWAALCVALLAGVAFIHYGLPPETEQERLELWLVTICAVLLFFPGLILFNYLIIKHVSFRKAHGRGPESHDVLPLEPSDGRMINVSPRIFD